MVWEQDFDDWDDVHLDIAKPPDLLHLFRDYHNYTLSDQAKVDKIRQLVRHTMVAMVTAVVSGL